jgi:hypothetical protein
MDVDATRTREEYLRQMRGRCFGCGSTTHTKKDGNHEREICGYCGRVGHRVVACMDKFLGRPKGQKTAGTEEEEESDVGSVDELSEESDVATVAATTTAALTQLLDQQKELANQIAELREQDF